MTIHYFSHTLINGRQSTVSNDIIPQSSLISTCGRLAAIAAASRIELYDISDVRSIESPLNPYGANFCFISSFPVADMSDSMDIRSLHFLKNGLLAILGHCKKGYVIHVYKIHFTSIISPNLNAHGATNLSLSSGSALEALPQLSFRILIDGFLNAQIFPHPAYESVLGVHIAGDYAVRFLDVSLSDSHTVRTPDNCTVGFVEHPARHEFFNISISQDGSVLSGTSIDNEIVVFRLTNSATRIVPSTSPVPLPTPIVGSAVNLVRAHLPTIASPLVAGIHSCTFISSSSVSSQSILHFPHYPDAHRFPQHALSGFAVLAGHHNGSLSLWWCGDVAHMERKNSQQCRTSPIPSSGTHLHADTKSSHDRPLYLRPSDFAPSQPQPNPCALAIYPPFHASRGPISHLSAAFVAPLAEPLSAEASNGAPMATFVLVGATGARGFRLLSFPHRTFRSELSLIDCSIRKDSKGKMIPTSDGPQYVYDQHGRRVPYEDRARDVSQMSFPLFDVPNYVDLLRAPIIGIPSSVSASNELSAELFGSLLPGQGLALGSALSFLPCADSAEREFWKSYPPLFRQRSKSNSTFDGSIALALASGGEHCPRLFALEGAVGEHSAFALIGSRASTAKLTPSDALQRPRSIDAGPLLPSSSSVSEFVPLIPSLLVFALTDGGLHFFGLDFRRDTRAVKLDTQAVLGIAATAAHHAKLAQETLVCGPASSVAYRILTDPFYDKKGEIGECKGVGCTRKSCCGEPRSMETATHRLEKNGYIPNSLLSLGDYIPKDQLVKDSNPIGHVKAKPLPNHPLNPGYSPSNIQKEKTKRVDHVKRVASSNLAIPPSNSNPHISVPVPEFWSFIGNYSVARASNPSKKGIVDARVSSSSSSDTAAPPQIPPTTESVRVVRVESEVVSPKPQIISPVAESYISRGIHDLWGDIAPSAPMDSVEETLNNSFQTNKSQSVGNQKKKSAFPMSITGRSDAVIRGEKQLFSSTDPDTEILEKTRRAHQIRLHSLELSEKKAKERLSQLSASKTINSTWHDLEKKDPGRYSSLDYNKLKYLPKHTLQRLAQKGIVVV